MKNVVTMGMLNDFKRFITTFNISSLFTTSTDKKCLSVEILIINKHLNKIETYDQLKLLITSFLKRYFLPKINYGSDVRYTSPIPFVARHFLNNMHLFASSYAFETDLSIIKNIRDIQAKYSHVDTQYQKVIEILYNDDLDSLDDVNTKYKIISSYYSNIKFIFYKFVIENNMTQCKFIPPTTEERYIISDIHGLIMRDKTIKAYYHSPTESCEAAAKMAVGILKEKYKCSIAELGIWVNGSSSYNPPINHFIVIASIETLDNVIKTFAVDITAHQFSRYGISCKIVDTLNNWFSEYQDKFNKKNRILVKYRDMCSVVTSNSKFDIYSNISSPFIFSSSEILSPSIWYKEENLPRETGYNMSLKGDIYNLKNCEELALKKRC
ncbi:hypothetical protein IB646_02345 [Francisella noatunensis]|uniref:hypothetical protein n=4 Tax=Francisella noatunensis TaxID=657445 RepID=UPI0019054AEB|nr:hypothetical protein [Francisella noatunensis]MBK2028419.1 hypothetical protein [Francisella noatunensis]